MTVTEILLITINALIVIGVAYVFINGGHQKTDNQTSRQEGDFLQHGH